MRHAQPGGLLLSVLIPTILIFTNRELHAAAGTNAGRSRGAEMSVGGSRTQSVAWQEAGVIHTRGSRFCKLDDVPVRAVRMGNGFWQPRMEANRTRGLPVLLDLLEQHGVVDNFRRLAGRKKVERRGPLFTDSDLYKWMEGAAFVLHSTDDAQLRAKLETIIDDVLAAQCEDGYLNTYYVDERADKRFTKLASDHELYCAGHLFQAAVAYYRATGNKRLLDGARRFADYLAAIFGPDKKHGAAGHPEIEMALVELYRTTGQGRCLELAGFLLEQLRFPSRDQIDGHAVRAAYMCCGGADYYAETGKAEYWHACRRLWQDMAEGKIYVTGGIGARHAGEAFGAPFELPNMQSYAETCAAIGNVFWNWRMLGITGEAKFADLMETALYNGVLAGVSLTGTEYFYVNPLASAGGAKRQAWHGCTCCPTNMVRMLASLPGYVFSTSPEGVWVHLYDTCTLDWRLEDGRRVSLAQQTRYPWDGTVSLVVTPSSPTQFGLFLRIPGWCRQASIRVNGKKAAEMPRPGSYHKIDRTWSPGDEVVLEMAMPAVARACDPRVRDNRGCVAVTRGPLVYCLESVDNPDVGVLDVALPINGRSGQPDLTAHFESDLLGGVTVLAGPGLCWGDAWEGGPLYRPLAEAPAGPSRKVSLLAIPYYAWANRGPSQMTVWIPLVRRQPG